MTHSVNVPSCMPWTTGWQKFINECAVFLFSLCLKANAEMVPKTPHVATACFSCSPPDLNFLDPYFIFMYMHNNHCHRVTAHL
jgi:hypothetical protein